MNKADFGIGAVINSKKMDICAVKSPSGIWIGRGGAFTDDSILNWLGNKDFEFEVKSMGVCL